MVQFHEFSPPCPMSAIGLIRPPAAASTESWELHHRDPRGAVQKVADHLVAHDDQGIDEVALGPAGGEEGLHQTRVVMAAFQRDVANELGQRIQARIEYGTAA